MIEKIASVLNVDLKALIKTESNKDINQVVEQEWIDLIKELKESGINKEQIKEYRDVIEFIKWKKENGNSDI
ncbi:hypothetical protein [Bacillus sp. T3]|uniref:hypothetical protein n=1 Tax=Bacillus sp. T3 TaxID=467262 RepID=UPI002982A859|nr:hypothetical protein [Bacillus sp. T3]